MHLSTTGRSCFNWREELSNRYVGADCRKDGLVVRRRARHNMCPVKPFVRNRFILGEQDGNSPCFAFAMISRLTGCVSDSDRQPLLCSRIAVMAHMSRELICCMHEILLGGRMLVETESDSAESETI
jgi:hypothetical protein